MDSLVVYYSGSSDYGESVAVSGGIPVTITSTGEILAAFWPDTYCADNVGDRTLTIMGSMDIEDAEPVPANSLIELVTSALILVGFGYLWVRRRI